MNSAETEPDRVMIPKQPDEVHPGSLLGLSTSLKPSLGTEGSSATRLILLRSLEAIGRVYDRVALLDLRQHPIPFFDGRLPNEYDNAAVGFCHECITRAAAVWLSAPAYWCGVSGVFKNLIDVLCGPAYDLDNPGETVFTGKPVGLLVVGTDHETALRGSEQARVIMNSTGARLIGEPVVIANPRAGLSDEEAVRRNLLVLGGELAQSAALEGPR